jgi:flagellin
MSLGRIGANIDAMWSYKAFTNVNNKMSLVQGRMSTGKKINSPEDDPAGYQLARSLEKRSRGLSVALQNVSNAKAVLNIAESAYQGIMDLLQVAPKRKRRRQRMLPSTIASVERLAVRLIRWWKRLKTSSTLRPSTMFS